VTSNPLSPELEAELDRLYELPLDEFTAARNDLSKRARKSGGKDVVATIKALPKPTISAWAVNQLARRQRGLIEAFVATSATAMEAQRRVFAGAGDVALREAMHAQRAVLLQLREAAAAVLTAGGHAAGASVLDRVGATLQALAGDAEGAAELARGRVDRDLDPPGFEALAGLAAGLDLTLIHPRPAAPAPITASVATKASAASSAQVASAAPGAPAPGEIDSRAREEAEAHEKKKALEAQAARALLIKQKQARVAELEIASARARREATAASLEADESEQRAERARRAAEDAARAAAESREEARAAEERRAQADSALAAAQAELASAQR
jgi:hypothetical protein